MGTLPSDEERVEQVVAECLEAADPIAAARAACARHPALASRIKAALAAVEAFGDALDAVSSSPDLAVPDTIAHYRVGRRIGFGGMGVVYVARDERLGREVALKLVRRDVLHFPGTRRRFRHEIEAVARMNHAGIVPIYDVGEQDGTPWYAMELVQGHSLDALRKHLAGRRPEQLVGRDVTAILADPGADTNDSALAWANGSWSDVCLHVVRQLARALAHAHERGILHRDIKPSNAILDRSGRARLLDFGLARQEGAERLTKTGTDVGSLAYMAPELLRGEDSSRRSDIYALGVTLYELLTLQLPYQGRHVEATRRAILEGHATSPRKLNRALSWDVATICECAMDLDPALRYASADAFADDLERALQRAPILARAPSWRLRLRRFGQRHPTLTILALLIALSAAAAPIGWNAIVRAERDQAVAARHHAEWQTYLGNIAAVGYGLAAMLPSEALRRLQACPEHLRSFEWHHCALRRDASLSRLDGHHMLARHVAFAPDSATVVTVDGAGTARRMDCRTGQLLAEVRGSGAIAIYVAISATTALVAAATAQGNIELCDLDARQGRVLVEGLGAVDALAITPDDRSVIACGNGFLTVVDVRSGAQRRAPLPDRAEAIAVTGPPSKLAVFGNRRLSLWDPPFERARSACRVELGEAFLMTFDHGGGRVAISHLADRQVVICDAESGAVVLRMADIVTRALAFTPDGTEIWVADSKQPTLQSRAVPSGSSKVTLRGHDDAAVSVACSPDGRYLASGSSDGSARIWLRTAPDTLALRQDVRPNVANTGAGVALMPDDEHFVWAGTHGRIEIVNARSGVATAAADGVAPSVYQISVRPDGQEIAVLSAKGKLCFWNGQSSNPVTGPLGDIGMPSTICYAGDLLAVGDERGAIRLLDRRRAVVAEVTPHQGRVVSLTATQNGQQIFSGGVDGRVFVLDIEQRTPRCLATLGKRVRSLALAPDEQRLFCAVGRDVHVLSLDQDLRPTVWRADGSDLTSVKVSPDGKRILTTGVGGGVILLATSTGERVLRLEAQGGGTKELVLARSGRWMAAADFLDGVTIWRADAPAVR